jgi:hypothetical protein
MSDITVEILKDIRTEMRGVRTEMREMRTELSARIDQTNERIDLTNDRLEQLERRQVETEVRLATQLVEVVGAVNAVREAIVEDRVLRRTVADHEDRISRLERERPPSRA